MSRKEDFTNLLKFGEALSAFNHLFNTGNLEKEYKQKPRREAAHYWKFQVLSFSYFAIAGGVDGTLISEFYKLK